jgi:hypothetical protein
VSPSTPDETITPSTPLFSFLPHEQRQKEARHNYPAQSTKTTTPESQRVASEKERIVIKLVARRQSTREQDENQVKLKKAGREERKAMHAKRTKQKYRDQPEQKEK